MADKIRITLRVVLDVRQHEGYISRDVGITIENFTKGFTADAKVGKVNSQTGKIVQDTLHHFAVAIGIHVIENWQIVSLGEGENFPFTLMILLETDAEGAGNTGNAQIIAFISQIEAFNSPETS